MVMSKKDRNSIENKYHIWDARTIDKLFNKFSYDKKIDVLNGIAYDKINDRLFVTGKFWPYVFENEMVSLTAP